MTAGSGADGQPAVLPDPEGLAPGRGAHLHPTTGCYELAVRRRAFSRALRLAQEQCGASSVPVGEYLTSINPTASTTERLEQ